MNTVQVALLLRDAVKTPGATSKTVILTTNGEVSFIFGPNNENALRFSIEQWNSIVEFADSQILQVFEDEQDKRAHLANLLGTVSHVTHQ